jgi:hypothetical protein
MTEVSWEIEPAMDMEKPPTGIRKVT